MADEQGYEIPEPGPPLEAVTAFLVICYPDGRKSAVSDVNMDLKLEREATLNDMYDGCGQVMRDIQIMVTGANVTQNVVNGMMQAMAAQMEAAQASQLASQLDIPGAVPLNRQQRRHQR